jgi:hypothetical protein
MALSSNGISHYIMFLANFLQKKHVLDKPEKPISSHIHMQLVNHDSLYSLLTLRCPWVECWG